MLSQLRVSSACRTGPSTISTARSAGPTSGQDLPRLPFRRETVLDVAPLYARLRAERPVTPVLPPAGDAAWLVTGYAEAEQLFADPRPGRSHPDPERASHISDTGLTVGSETTRSCRRIRGPATIHLAPGPRQRGTRRCPHRLRRPQPGQPPRGLAVRHRAVSSRYALRSGHAIRGVRRGTDRSAPTGPAE